MPTKIQLRRGTASEWTSANPILASGEVGVETDSKKFKIGDGSSYWNSLQYSTVTSADVADAIADHVAEFDPHTQYETSVEAQARVDLHANRTDNPHSVTKSQVGLGNVDNVSAADLRDRSTHTGTQTASTISDFETAATAVVNTHANRTDNPHAVTKSQVGLGNVDNVSASDLRDRSTHTGTQLASTISDFSSAVNSVTLDVPEIRGEILWAKNATDDLMDISELIAFASTMGLTHGGRMTVSSGRVINVDEMSGYTMINVPYETHRLVKVVAAPTTIEIPANSSLYVYYTASGVLSTSSTLPSNRTNIILGRVVTNDTDVLYIEKSELDAHHWSNYVDRMLREALGPVFASGALVSANATPLKLDVSSGVYFYGEHRLTLSSATAATWSAYYRDGAGGSSRIASQDAVSVTQYDDGSGTLASIPDGKWVKHLLYAIKEQTGTQKFALVYAQSYQDTDGQAAAAGLPIAPAFMTNSFVKLASIVVQKGASSIGQIIDERPRLGFVSSSVAGSVTQHSDLFGLGDDDHTQYLLANGARPLEGDLDGGGHALDNFSTFNGVTVEAHADRHQPGGADALPTASAVSIASSNAEGSSTSFARADHAHKIDDGFVTNSMLAGSIDAVKIGSGSVSNTEFSYLDGVTSSIQSQINGKEPTITAGTAEQYYRGDKTFQTLDKTAVGLGNVDNVSAASLRDRSTHTGTQLASTISDFTTAVQGVTIDASKIDGGVVSNSEFATLDGITTGVSIQSQIDGKQATITGAATTITSSNLTVSRSLVSNASGKVAVSAVTTTEIEYLSGVTSSVQSQIDGKEPSITGAASSITSLNLSLSKAVVSDGSGKIAASATTSVEVGYLSGVTSAIQTQLDGKQATITGAATTITASNLTASRALASDGSGKVAVSAVTSTELGYLSGTTSPVQTQLNAKANLAGGNTFTGKQALTATTTDAGLNVGSTTADPSTAVAGDVWYNSTTGDLKIKRATDTQTVRTFLNKQVITSGTTYTPTAGAKYIEATLIGGGGGGGGASGAANNVATGGGGGAGAVCMVATSLPGAASYTIAIGSAGLAGSSGLSGGAATATTLAIGATTYSAGGGLGGGGMAAGTTVLGATGGVGGTATNGAVNVNGAYGGTGYRFSGTTGFPGKGADTMLGAGGLQPNSTLSGFAGLGYGAGGSGAFAVGNGNRTGGAGTPGIIIITEYA